MERPLPNAPKDLSHAKNSKCNYRAKISKCRLVSDDVKKNSGENRAGK